MLIGIDASRSVAAQRTGTEVYSLELVRALLGLGSGHRFRLYTNGQPPPGLFWGPGLPAAQPGVAEIRNIPFTRLWTHVRLSLEVIWRRPDVLFVPAHVLPLLHPPRSVVTIHDLGYLHYPEAHRGRDRRYLEWSTKWNARQARLVIADSQATCRDLVAEHGVDPARIRVVYLGGPARAGAVAHGETDPMAQGEIDAVRRRYGLGERYLLYVGTLQPRKNLERVVQAFARLAGAERFAGLQLVLAGRRGWLYEPLLAALTRLGLGGRVILPGYVPGEHLPALYAGALGYVFPSLYEGFGMPVLEAQGQGVPVLTSNNSSLPEVAGDGALFVDPHDVEAIAEAMARLATDEALREDLIRRGYANVARFSWEKCARETLAVLEEVAGKRR